MEITIRRTVKEDCPRLLELIQELAEYERAPDAVTVTLDHFEQSGFGEKPVWWGFCAEAHFNPGEKGLETKRAEVVGFALYYIRYSTWKGQRMYLEDILVTNEMRNIGIGSMLMDQLIHEAKKKKFSAIVWQVLDWNQPAINFYKKYNTHFDAEWVNCSLLL